ncbi:YraN family protein [Paenibacillus sp. PL2-23]|uniref:YraN family protein n=1 Tax=Paenibacillus sp. PL2-23 TaxID=2100729 RepID=UPI0030F76116
MTVNRKRLGALGEAEASRRLALQGYEILETNWRSRLGELDLIAREGGRLVFIEVRARSAGSVGRFGTAAESVDARKQNKLRSVAAAYLTMTRQRDAFVRFDVIAVTIGEDDRIEAYTHYEAAF